MTLRWSELLGKRVWESRTPESHRGVLAAWHWVHTWSDIPQPNPVPFKSVAFSVVLPDLKIIQRLDEPPLLSFKGTEWGGNAIKLRQVTRQGVDFFETLPEPVWVHMLNPCEWVVVPFESAPPLQGVLEQIQIGNRVVLRKSGEPLPLLKVVFSQKVTLTFDNLLWLATLLGIPRQHTRAALLRDITIFVQGDLGRVESLDCEPEMTYKVPLVVSIAPLHRVPIALRSVDYC